MGLSSAELVDARAFPAGSWSLRPGPFVVDIRELFETAFFGGHR
jgi:hypothetical protein